MTPTLPALPGRVLDLRELRLWVTELAERAGLWMPLVRHEAGTRHYASLYRDSDIDVWVLCWNVRDDTGWHDHDVSSGAVAVVSGELVENNLTLAQGPAQRRASDAKPGPA